MKKILLLSLLLCVAGTASAGWALLQETREGILYVDRDGAEKTSNGWRVDISQDFHMPQIHEGKEYLSEKSRYDLDCGAKKIRTLNVERFPENMARGDKVHADSKAGEWTLPEKGSRMEIVLKSLCR